LVNKNHDVWFDFLKSYANYKNSSAFLKAATTTLLHTISESKKASYVAHMNNYLAQDEFLNRYLPIDPSTNDRFEIAKDGVLLW
jgi:plastin-1